jgi:hypothetical protein
VTQSVTVDLDDEGIPDFTPPRGPRFRVYAEVYEGVREIGADVILEMMAQIQDLDEVPVSRQLEIIKEVMGGLLVADSATRFVANMSNRQDPIGLQTLQKAVNWLMEQYLKRPTEPDSGSSPGSESRESGTSSTETTLVEELTFSDYRLIDSST